MADGLDQGAVFQITGLHSRAVFATGFPAELRIKGQLPFDLMLVRMALVAAAFEDGLDLGAEELRWLVGGGASLTGTGTGTRKHRKDRQQDDERLHAEGNAMASQAVRRILST